MNKIKRLGLVLGGAVLALGTAAPAMATPPSGSSGFNEKPDVIVAQGSDTSYWVSNQIAVLYNTSEGCDTNNSTNNADDCKATVAGGVNDPNDADGWRQTLSGKYANWDHDQLVNAAPIGSGNGRNCLLASLTCTNPADLVRSSSGPGTNTGVSNWAFASEQIAVVAVNPGVAGGGVGRSTSTLNVTQPQLVQLYGAQPGCSALKWSDLGDTLGASGDTVVPFGMNSGSGTYGTFRTFIGGAEPNAGACVVGTPFENDVEELFTAPQAAVYNAGTGVWWMSGATYTNFPVLSRTLSAMTISGAPLYDPAYPATLARTVSFVTLKTAAPWCTAVGTAGTTAVAGCVAATTLGNAASTGKPGAVREFIRYLCRATNSFHILQRDIQNDVVGKQQNAQVTARITAAGFKSVAGANFGRCVGSSN